ncbi:Oidioi.mRNA.OKI2018_I69.chr2.g5418.t1.cds [Oikopleura dioica]|uniref:Oidioi.mRNA.OKI2018_I69.chr2.g5418.t1.cds n=1 Tax=Oikopleura dioica TaxID=34765 RepID=A0ABN7T1Y8_OIKDI|nr:Oidioi.mRNA.OKI2018_I69.chr2.g5418.t1.cds [Oikopleura dioica]
MRKFLIALIPTALGKPTLDSIGNEPITPIEFRAEFDSRFPSKETIMHLQRQYEAYLEALAQTTEIVTTTAPLETTLNPTEATTFTYTGKA